ncbi:MAG TPA: M42 family metallopeptidase [Candidatus Acidoferrum sp.]|nr:M42 family metallopeptidase [Candidatus Acidoferrum sp.]
MELLKRMIETLSVTGNEEKLAELIISEITPYVDSVEKDVMGNVIAFKKGKSSKKLMLSAHMDEIGFMVTQIDKDGFIHFGRVGGLHPLHIASCPVIFKNGTRGVLMYESKVEAKDLTLDNFYIDIGAGSKEEAEKYVRPGDVAGTYGSVFDCGDHRMAGKSMDDKIACYIEVTAIQRMEGTPAYDTYFVFSTQEEVGLRGATTAAYRVEPDYAIALDVTGVGDEPGQKQPNAVKLGKGAAVKVRDASIVCSHKMVDHLVDLAREKEIPYQMEVLMYGGTDAGAIHLTKGGVVTGGISIPSRYIHSPVEMVDKRDVEACTRLLLAAVFTELK